MPIADRRCRLLKLPAEIIFEILSHLSVEGISNLENTCKCLYEICRSRLVWRALIEELDVDQAPNLLPYETLESLSGPDLRRKVCNAVHRNQAWNASTREIRLVRDAELPLSHIEENKFIKVRLLPGGKEVLLANSGNVELWSIKSGLCLWTTPAPEDHIDYVGFDFDLVENGRVLLIATVCDDNVLTSTSLVRLFSYDFQHRAGEVVFERRLPPVSPSRIMLHGNFFISSIPRNFQTVVINWKTGNALILDFIDPTGLRIDARAKLLAGDNLIAFVQLTEPGFCAVKLPLSELRGFWSDDIDHNAWRHVPFRPAEQGYTILPLPYPRDPLSIQSGSTGFGPWILTHHVFRPPWKSNAPTEIFIAAYTVGPGGETPMRLLSIRLQLEDSGALMFVKSCSGHVARLPRNPRSITNAGLTFSLRQKLQCFSLFSDGEQPISELELGPDVIPHFDGIEPNVASVDPWSSAIAVRTPGMIKVLYFDETESRDEAGL